MNVAVIGASSNPEKYGYKIVKHLSEKGHQVFPVNPTADEILGHKVYKCLSEINSSPDIINFVVPPKIGFELVKKLGEDKLKGSQLFFQPGALDDEFRRYLDEKEYNWIGDSCIML